MTAVVELACPDCGGALIFVEDVPVGRSVDRALRGALEARAKHRAATGHRAATLRIREQL